MSDRCRCKSPFRLSGDKQCLLQILALVFITAVLYGRSIGSAFMMQWDDQWMVFNHYTSDGLTISNLQSILTDIYYGQYSPLNQLVYTILFYISGYNPLVYHGFSVFLHILNVALAYLFIRALLLSMRGELLPAVTDGTEHKAIGNAAFLAAILFGVHPVNVETVSWVSASKIVLYSFNYLLGLLLYVKFTNSRSKMTYFAIILFSVLAFGAKEQAVAFVLSCFVIDYAVRRKERVLDLVVEKLPMIFIALFFGVVTMMTHWHAGFVRMPEYSGFADRIVLASYSIFEYAVKTLIPWNLSYIYPFPYQPYENIPINYWIYTVFALATGYAVYLCRRNRLLVFAVFFFTANLLLMLHFIPMGRFTILCDRYLYLALIGPATFIGWISVNLLRKHRVIASIVLILYLCYLSCYTFLYQDNWKNSDTLKKEIRQNIRNREGFNNESL